MAAAAALGYRFAIVKAQQGNDGPNPLFDAQVAAVRGAGLIVGAYGFAEALPDDGVHPNRDPRDQAQLFFNASRGLGSQRGDLPFMLDLEDPPVSRWAAAGCSSAQIRDWALACLEECQILFGRTPMLYVGLNFWANVAIEGGVDDFARYPLVMAAYPGPYDTVTPPEGAVVPNAPAPWTKATFWQHGDKLPAPAAGSWTATCSWGMRTTSCSS